MNKKAENALINFLWFIACLFALTTMLIFIPFLWPIWVLFFIFAIGCNIAKEING